MSLQRRCIEVGGNHASICDGAQGKGTYREKEGSQHSRMLLRGQETWQAGRHPLDLKTAVEFARAMLVVLSGQRLDRRGGGGSSGREGMEAVV